MGKLHNDNSRARKETALDQYLVSKHEQTSTSTKASYVFMRLDTTNLLFPLQGLCFTAMANNTIDSHENSTKITIHGHGDLQVRYREVPASICETHPGVKSYAGYVDISADEHMFFWFFEARVPDPSSVPLTAWISGGPGNSAMAELFTEHGPCRIDPDGETVHYNPFSWNEYSNMLYIDQPVGVGFSYTHLVRAYLDGDEEKIVKLEDDENCPTDASVCGMLSDPEVVSNTTNSTPGAAPNFWLILQAFMTSFPQYCNHGLNLGSESYGGHYIPVFAKYLLDQNDQNIAGTRHIDLRSILIGNGWFSALIQVPSFYEYAFDGGNPYDLLSVGDSTGSKVRHALYKDNGAIDKLKRCTSDTSDEICRSATDFWGDKVFTPWVDESERDDNDVRQKDPSPFPNMFYVDYLRRDDVRKAIGAVQTYVELNPTVGAAFESTGDDSRGFSIPKILGELVEKAIRVTLYAGDADYECNWLGVEDIAEAINANGFGETGYTNISTNDGVIHGQVKQSGLFSFVRVYEAGHAVGAFQPLLLQ